MISKNDEMEFEKELKAISNENEASKERAFIEVQENIQELLNKIRIEQEQYKAKKEEKKWKTIIKRIFKFNKK